MTRARFSFPLGMALLAAVAALSSCGRGGAAAVAVSFAPSEVALKAVAGADATPVRVQVQTTSPVDVECGTTAPWLTVSPEKGKAPGTLTLSVKPAGLPVGTHSAQATVRIAGTSAPFAIPVKVEVTAAGPPSTGPAGSPVTEAAAPATATSPPRARDNGVPYGQGALLGGALVRTEEATVFIESIYRPAGRDPAGLSDDDRATATGSGAVIDPRGLVLTNEHVVSALFVPEAPADAAPADAAARRRIYVLDRVRVHLHSGTERHRVFEGEVVATRPFPYDVALVRIDPDTQLAFVPGLDPANRTSLNFMPGETHRVWAVGFPLGHEMENELERFKMSKNANGPDVSVREGVTTALRRDAHGNVKAIEHSCPIEPGNSGGPLVDENGWLVGVNSFGGQKSCFAIPVATVADVYFDTLACNGYGNLLEGPSARTLTVDPSAPPPAPGAKEEDRLVFNRIDDALKAAKNGDVVRLVAAEFRLKEPLQVRTGIRLKGAGAGKTVLRAWGEEGRGIDGYCVLLGGKRYVEIHDLSVVNDLGNGIWVTPDASDQMHVHDVEVKVAHWAFGAGERTAPDVIGCDFRGAVAFHSADCKPRLERVRVRSEFTDRPAVQAVEGAAPTLRGCRLVGPGGSVVSLSGSHPVLVGCEIPQLYRSTDPEKASIRASGAEVDAEDCACWSRGGATAVASEDGTVRLKDSWVRGGFAPALAAKSERSRVEVSGTLFERGEPGVWVAGFGSASVAGCAFLWNDEKDLSEWDPPDPVWPFDLVAVAAVPVFPGSEEELKKREEEREEEQRHQPYALLVTGENARLSYKECLFSSKSEGTAVRLEKSAPDGDDGDNRWNGEQTQKGSTDEEYYPQPQDEGGD